MLDYCPYVIHNVPVFTIVQESVMAQKQLLTRKEARESLIYRGKSITQWAEEHGFTVDQVRDVLRKDRPCRIGVSHKVAVLMGIKDGIIEE